MENKEERLPLSYFILLFFKFLFKFQSVNIQYNTGFRCGILGYSNFLSTPPRLRWTASVLRAEMCINHFFISDALYRTRLIEGTCKEFVV